MDQLDFEEVALKSIDPSLGPSLRFNDSGKLRQQDHPQIPLIYPPSVCAMPLSHLRTLLKDRTPRHYKGFITWLSIVPFTAPLKLVRTFPIPISRVAPHSHAILT